VGHQASKEKFNAKIRTVFRNGRFYTVERLLASVLYTNMLLKGATVQQGVKLRRKSWFEDSHIEKLARFSTLYVANVSL